MAKMGRPKIYVDWQKVDLLCKVQCTEEEIAAELDISVDTLYRRCLEEHKMTFAEYFAIKRKRGFSSLRAKQYDLAMNHDNATMLVWLGKQWLGQSDKHTVKQEHEAPDLSKLTDEELEFMAKIQDKLNDKSV